MPTKYHNKVVSLFKEVTSNKKNFFINPNNRKLKLDHPYKDQSVKYNPDHYFENRKNGKYCIIEVLDSQEKEKSKTIADIFRIIFFKKCYRAIFTVKNVEEKDAIDTICETIKVIVCDYVHELTGQSKKDTRLNPNKLLKLDCIVLPKNLEEDKMKKEIEKLF